MSLTNTPMKLTNEQHEQLLDALELFKQADAEDINAVIDAHDGEDERLATVINLRDALEQSICRLEDDLSDEIAYYEETAAEHEKADTGLAAQFYRFALHSRATQYLARSQVENTPMTPVGRDFDVEMIIKEQGGSLFNKVKYEAAVDELTEVMLDK